MKYNRIKEIIEQDISPEDKTRLIFALSLKKQQRDIFLSLPKGEKNAISCADIAIITGLASKNISTLIRNLREKIIIKDVGVDVKKKYYL